MLPLGHAATTVYACICPGCQRSGHGGSADDDAAVRIGSLNARLVSILPTGARHLQRRAPRAGVGYSAVLSPELLRDRGAGTYGCIRAMYASRYASCIHACDNTKADNVFSAAS